MKMTENEDGTIEFQATKKSKWFWRWGYNSVSLLPLAFLCLTTWLSISGNPYNSFGSKDVMVIMIGVGFAFAGWLFAKFKMAQAKRTFYRLTKHGIEIRSGITHEEVLTVPWSAVRLVTVFRRDIDLMLSQGQVHVECAGDTYPEIEFKGLDNWEEVKDILLERMAMAGK